MKVYRIEKIPIRNKYANKVRITLEDGSKYVCLMAYEDALPLLHKSVKFKLNEHKIENKLTKVMTDIRIV